MNVAEQLRRQVELARHEKLTDAPVVKLAGDASNRVYYRVGTPPNSYVLMQTDLAKQSEEASQSEIPKELPFINIHRYLEAIGVRVPRVFRHDECTGTIVLEDVTDETFEKAQGEGNRVAWYTKAVHLLAQVRARAEANPDSSCIAFNRVFDKTLYLQELHHFRKWGLETRVDQRLAQSELTELSDIFEHIAERLAVASTGFTHRDYQSRNLMVKDGELVLIDFQDALQGPRQYDLVALLRDSYVELPKDFVDAMVREYILAFEREAKEKIPVQPFERLFELLTVQRKLKDAGRFEFIHRVKGNPGFLKFVPASLRYVKAALEVQPDLSGLQRIIAKYLPELE